jgi:hypothetical protein
MRRRKISAERKRYELFILGVFLINTPIFYGHFPKTFGFLLNILIISTEGQRPNPEEIEFRMEQRLFVERD